LKLELVSTRHALKLTIDARSQPGQVKVFSRPDAQGAHAAISLDPRQGVKAVNDQGQPLILNSKVLADGGSTRYEIELFYTIDKRQASWANGVEHGRYSIEVGKQVRNFFLASSEAQVRRGLERELAGGLRTWEAVFKQYGYIPSGIGTGSNGTGHAWDEYSDAGGYAHLICAAAQWLLYSEGKNDWEMHRLPNVIVK
jgi:hypothetical protein